MQADAIHQFAVMVPIVTHRLPQAQGGANRGVGVEPVVQLRGGEPLAGDQRLAAGPVDARRHGPLLQGQGQRRHQGGAPERHRGDGAGKHHQQRPAVGRPGPAHAPETGQREQGGEHGGTVQRVVGGPFEDQRQQYQQRHEQRPGMEAEIQRPVAGEPEIQRVDDADQGAGDHQAGEQEVLGAAGPLQDHERQAEEERLLMHALQHQLQGTLGQGLHGPAAKAAQPEVLGEQHQPGAHQYGGEHRRQPGFAFHQEVTGQAQGKAAHRPEVAQAVEERVKAFQPAGLHGGVASWVWCVGGDACSRVRLPDGFPGGL